MIPFEVVEPSSFREAIGLLDPSDDGIRPFAGGTALLLMMKAGVFQPTRLVSLRRVRDANAIALDCDGGLRLGAMTTLNTLERSPAVMRACPVLASTLRSLSNVRVRNVATVGGALAHGDPHMDLPPVLIALNARVTAMSLRGTREIPLADLYRGYYETALAGDELVTDVTVPPLDGRRALYVKCTTRSAHDWPALGIAIAMKMADGRIADPRVVVSAATEKASLLPHASAVLAGKIAEPRLYAEAAGVAAEEIELTSDSRGSAAYKRHLVRVHLARALSRVATERE